MMTDFDLLDSIYPLALDDLPRQWVLGTRGADLPSEWQHRDLHGWTLAAHHDAKVCSLVTAEEDPIGWVLEPLLHTTSEHTCIPRDKVTLPAGGLSETFVEQAIYGRNEAGRSDGTGLEGMWIAIIVADAMQRVYLGPAHSAVFDRDKRRVATSHNLLAPFTRDRELSRAFDPLETNGYFSFGLTAFAGVERLLPNHYLDLETFAPQRHWPRAPFAPGGGRGCPQIDRAWPTHYRRHRPGRAGSYHPAICRKR